MLPPGRLPNAEKLQLSVFLPNELSLEDWFLLDDVLGGATRLARKASIYLASAFTLSDTHSLAVEGGK